MVHERLGKELVTRGHEVNYVYITTKYESKKYPLCDLDSQFN